MGPPGCLPERFAEDNRFFNAGKLKGGPVGFREDTVRSEYADKLEDERPNKGFSDVVYESIEILRKAQEK